MRFEFDAEKNRKVSRRHGVSREESQEIFDQAYLVDRKCDDPEQFRAIGYAPLSSRLGETPRENCIV